MVGILIVISKIYTAYENFKARHYSFLTIVSEIEILCSGPDFLPVNFLLLDRGRSRISRKGIHMYKGVGVRFADFISFFLNIPWK